MDDDITPILERWPFEPGRINARAIVAGDGTRRIQVRLDLGVIQMFADGRPDGQRPFGFPSLLEYHESRLDVLEGGREGEDPEPADDEPKGELVLSAEECRSLRDEAVQYYHRYVAMFALEDFEAVVRDTSRNLRVLDLCRKHAEREEDRRMLEQFRPYVMMLRARALAGQLLKEGESKAAVLALEDGLEQLRRHFQESDQPQMFERSSEVQMLQNLRDALVPKLPVSQKAELKQRLARALEQENYELAAILRDELNGIKE